MVKIALLNENYCFAIKKRTIISMETYLNSLLPFFNKSKCQKRVRFNV